MTPLSLVSVSVPSSSWRWSGVTAEWILAPPHFDVSVSNRWFRCDFGRWRAQSQRGLRCLCWEASHPQRERNQTGERRVHSLGPEPRGHSVQTAGLRHRCFHRSRQPSQQNADVAFFLWLPWKRVCADGVRSCKSTAFLLSHSGELCRWDVWSGLLWVSSAHSVSRFLVNDVLVARLSPAWQLSHFRNSHSCGSLSHINVKQHLNEV